MATLGGDLTNINSTVLAETLSSYINSVSSTNVNYALDFDKVDEIVGKLNGTFYTNTTQSFIMAEQVDRTQNLTALGVSFTQGVGGSILRPTATLNTSSIILGAVVTDRSLADITSLNMLVIADPLEYEKIGDSNTRTLASSVIVVTAERSSPSSPPINVSLYFQPLNKYKPTYVVNASCSYYNQATHKWDNTRCSVPYNNSNRYECICNHLSTYALIWSRFIPSCNLETEVQLDNGTCSPKENVQV